MNYLRLLLYALTLLGVTASSEGQAVDINYENATALVAASSEIRIIPYCRYCLSVEEVGLSSEITRLQGESFMVISSRLILMDEHGRVLASIDDPYGDNGKAISGRSASGVTAVRFQTVLSGLPVGSYMAVFKLNELSSNAVRITVSPDRQVPIDHRGGCQGSVQIKSVVDAQGVPVSNQFLAHYRNEGTESAFLPSVWGGSCLLVDGEPHQLGGWRGWGGSTNLEPGKSWGSIVDLRSFVSADQKAIMPGEHEVQYVLGGCWSNVIHINVEGKQAQP
jgi:hypothetical protein